METFSQKLHLLQGSNLLDADFSIKSHPSLENCQRINGWFYVNFICLFFCFYVVWQRITKKVDGQQ